MLIPHLTLHIIHLSKYPFLVKRKACDYVDGVRDEVGEVSGFHVLRDEFAKGATPGGVVENVDCRFEGGEVEQVGGDEDDDEPDDFGALAVMALEIPDAVHQVAVDRAENEPEEVG